MDVTRKKIERIIITGLLDEYKKAQAYCQANGFRIIQTNPRLTDEKYQHKVTSFEIVAEKESEGG
jgi:hypothetical protein